MITSTDFVEELRQFLESQLRVAATLDQFCQCYVLEGTGRIYECVACRKKREGNK